MSEWPILSLTTFLPTVGALFILMVRGDAPTVARNARMTALWTSVTTFVLSLYLWVDFDTAEPGFQFVERAAWDPLHGGLLPPGGGRHLGLVRDPVDLPDAALHPGELGEAIQSRVKEYMNRLPVARDLHGRDVLRA